MTTNTEHVVREIMTRLEPIVESIVFHAVQKHTHNNSPDEITNMASKDTIQHNVDKDDGNSMRARSANAAPSDMASNKIRSNSIADRIMNALKEVKSIEIAELAEIISATPSSTDRVARKLASQGRCKKDGKIVTYLKFKS